MSSGLWVKYRRQLCVLRVATAQLWGEIEFLASNLTDLAMTREMTFVLSNSECCVRIFSPAQNGIILTVGRQ